MHGSHEYMLALPANFKFPDRWDAGVPHVATPAVIPPKGDVGGPKLTLPLSVEESLANGKAGHYYMWGWAKYHDVFPKTEEHISEYCWRVLITRVSGVEGKPEAFLASSENCPTHNCTDEECKINK
jgi:hypothetical protein